MDRFEGYSPIMARRGEIMRRSVGIDYESFTTGKLAFDYERMMEEIGYTLDEVKKSRRNPTWEILPS